MPQPVLWRGDSSGRNDGASGPMTSPATEIAAQRRAKLARIAEITADLRGLQQASLDVMRATLSAARPLQREKETLEREVEDDADAIKQIKRAERLGLRGTR